jgi:DNA (cytosine-5)-methyltransferase 1
MSRVYYNEFHPGKAAALRELIRAGLIAPGDVDDRSILDVRASDLVGYAQCHFFAGIGIWSYALRLAGWPDDRPVWTGSAPCQPLSVAGKRKGFDDARHLAPVWLDLIHECAPELVFGEQVAGAVREGWLDPLQDELEGRHYAFGAATFPACGVGAPHIRQRLYFGAVRVADANDAGSQGRGRVPECAAQQPAGARGVAGGLADNDGQRHDRLDALLRAEASGWDEAGISQAAGCGGLGGLADAERDRPKVALFDAGGVGPSDQERQASQLGGHGAPDRPRPLNGFWRDADWLFCRDGKWRPVEPGTSPLADGSAGRVLALHCYGDGIVAQQAAAFIQEFSLAAAEIGVRPDAVPGRRLPGLRVLPELPGASAPGLFGGR